MKRINDDDDEILKDGQRVRISMTMRDAAIRDAKFTDGRTTDPTALNRPGFRVPAVQDRRAVHDAYEAYEADLTNAYLGGAQSEDTTDDPAITDSNTKKQDKMQDCYAAYDHELTEAWRGR
jgi:hypothetical protein